MAKKKPAIEWEALKSGAMKGPDGWYASQYTIGWYFVYSETSGSYDPKKKFSGVHTILGPFKTFALGLVDWEKNNKL